VPEIEALGATLVAISPQLPEHSREVAGRFGLRFTLPDYLRTLYATFPLGLTIYNGDDSWTLPMPARFVIDQEGVIRDAQEWLRHHDKY
jgi:peroxiredoxin